MRVHKSLFGAVLSAGPRVPFREQQRGPALRDAEPGCLSEEMALPRLREAAPQGLCGPAAAGGAGEGGSGG